MKTCYYELIGVERRATEDEIKKAFKKLAMKLHPDKNHDDPDATKKFQELNEAYQVLIDPNERAWYDSHRTQILSGKQMGEDSEGEDFDFNIWQFFSQSCYKGFGDGPGGYFGVYGSVFNDILKEEEQARLDNINKEENLPSFKKAPSFGDSLSSDAEVLRFYEYWDNFITAKSFSWADEYKISKDYERRVNRMIEQDNKKARVVQKKKYMDTIRQFVEYVKKRDPRIEKIREREKEREEEKRQSKLLMEEEKKRVKKENLQRAREEEMRRFEELDRMKENGKKAVEQEEEEEVDEFYCAPCQKGFKSENQLKNHEKSKQHLKAVKDLLSEVAMDDELHIVEGVQKELDRIEQIKGESVGTGGGGKSKKKKKNKKKKAGLATIQSDSEDDDENKNEEENKQEANVVKGETEQTGTIEAKDEKEDDEEGDQDGKVLDEGEKETVDEIEDVDKKGSINTEIKDKQETVEDDEDEELERHKSFINAKTLKKKQERAAKEQAAKELEKKKELQKAAAATLKKKPQGGESTKNEPKEDQHKKNPKDKQKGKESKNEEEISEKPEIPSEDATKREEIIEEKDGDTEKIKEKPKEKEKKPLPAKPQQESDSESEDEGKKGGKKKKKGGAGSKQEKLVQDSKDPLVCKICGEKEESKTSLMTHLKKKHKLKF